MNKSQYTKKPTTNKEKQQKTAHTCTEDLEPKMKQKQRRPIIYVYVQK